MAFSPADVASPHAVGVTVDSEALRVELSDGRVISVPLAWYPRLSHGGEAERGNWRLIAAGSGIHWPDLDEDISVASLLEGRRSAETRASVARWLESRGKDASRT